MTPNQKYKRTEKGKASTRRYTHSEKGKAVQRRAYQKHEQKKVLQVVERAVAVDPGSLDLDVDVDMLDIRILAALLLGKMSFREIGEFAGLEKYKPQLLAWRVKGLVGRGWVKVGKMEGKGNGAKRMRTLTRGGRAALKRLGGVIGGGE